ncbi:MAG: 2-dehydropantoate 2-reductase [Pseudomonadota bacterium]
MRIVIMGAGAVGGYFGARLAAAGEDVTFVARGAHLEAMRTGGLRIESGLGDLSLDRVNATDDLTGHETAEIVLFLVKLYDTVEGIDAIKPVVGPNTLVTSFQNGISAEAELTSAFGDDRAAGGVAYIAADVRAPGVIRHTSQFARLLAGTFDGRTDQKLTRLAEVAERAGVEIDVVDDIRKRIWEKFVMLTAFSAMTSLTRLPIGPILDDALCNGLYREAVEESFNVARHYEPSVDPGFVDQHMHRVEGFPPNMRSSMLDDLLRGKRLEVDELSGRVAALAVAAGIQAPFHAMVAAALNPYRNGAPEGAVDG